MRSRIDWAWVALTGKCIFVDLGDFHVRIKEDNINWKLHVFSPKLRALIESVNKKHSSVVIKIWSVGEPLASEISGVGYFYFESF